MSNLTSLVPITLDLLPTKAVRLLGDLSCRSIINCRSPVTGIAILPSRGLRRKS